MEDKLRIAITPERPLEREGEAITRLLESGRFTDVHLRHPEESARNLLKIIEEIPQKWHGRLHLHGHFDLANEFNLGGLHLNKRCPKAPALYTGKVSASCHSIEEVKRAAERGLAYVTLSPILDSISKPGYGRGFTDEELRSLDAISGIAIVALGGITPRNLHQLRPYNFSGYAMLGGVDWQSK